jgi:predicted transcriptional regulator
MKTMAIRLEDDTHAQLSILAQLETTSVADVIRQAIEAHLVAKRSQPELMSRAESVLADIDAEAAQRRSAIATLFGNAEGNSTTTATSGSRGRRKTSEEG